MLVVCICSVPTDNKLHSERRCADTIFATARYNCDDYD